MEQTEQVKRWRLILGKETEEELQSLGAAPNLSENELIMDEALAAIYDKTSGFAYDSGGKGADKSKSSPKVARWLADIRTFFKDDLVSLIQADAIERKGLTQLLFEPETLKNVKPDIEIVGTLLALKGQIPERTKETAREVVRSVVEDINKRLETDLRRAITGALNRKAHSPIPSAVSIDWKTTLRKNVKHYHTEIKTVIPERFYFFDRSQKRNKWTVIVDIDQSGSMADSVIYGSVVGCIFSSMASLKTHVIAFDTEVVDLSEQYGTDPVDMLFGIQLGGGTDINKSIAYCQQFITDPANTIFILLSDLYEGGNISQMYARIESMAESGVKILALTALSDRGSPSYDTQAAKRLANMGIPCFSCTPKMLPQMLEGALKGRNLVQLAQTVTAKK